MRGCTSGRDTLFERDFLQRIGATSEADRMERKARRASAVRGRSVILKRWGEPRELQGGERPEGLGALSEPPEQLYLWGALPALPWVSIVGTRTPSRQGALDAFHLARRLARLGITVASGGALGIDTAAHLGALAGRGRTVVVAPTFLPFAYPKRNHALFAAILEAGGGYLTAADQYALPLKFAFFRRNEVLMALSHATVLGECPTKSGARNAMQHARKLGRARFALPFRFAAPSGQGTYAEVLQEGAEVIWDETPVVRLLEEYGSFAGRIPRMQRADDGPGSEAADPLHMGSREERLVLGAVRKGALTVDAICIRCGLSADAVQHALLLLTLGGHVAEDDRGLLRPS